MTEFAMPGIIKPQNINLPKKRKRHGSVPQAGAISRQELRDRFAAIDFSKPPSSGLKRVERRNGNRTIFTYVKEDE